MLKSMKIYITNVKQSRTEFNFNEGIKFISSTKQKKLMKFKHKNSAWSSLIADLLIRTMIIEQTQIKNNDIKFGYGAKGKPFLLNDKNLQFNVSHSKDIVICAVAQNEIGVDIEYTKRASKNYLEIAKRFFSQSEYNSVKNDGKDAFFKIWTLKEAYVKAIGTGITIPLKDFSVPLKGNLSKINNKNWFFENFNYGDYCISLCSSSNNLTDNFSYKKICDFRKL